MKKLIVKLMAEYLPDECGFERLFGIPICQLNPLYAEVIEQKMINKGYGS